MCKPDRTNFSAGRRENARGTSQKTGDANYHLSPWNVKTKAWVRHDIGDWEGICGSDFSYLIPTRDLVSCRCSCNLLGPWKQSTSAPKKTAGGSLIWMRS